MTQGRDSKSGPQLFFTSDTHFGHANIIKYCNRPFLSAADERALADGGGTWHRGNWKGDGSSEWRISQEAVELMNDTLINNINAMVGENDILWHLGDWAFARKDQYYYKCREYRDRIKCRNVNLIWGNHDYRSISNLFYEAHDMTEIEIGRQKITLNHYAMAIWNKSHRGAWHMYGHSHSGAEEWLDRNMKGRRAFDVGVDNAFKLFGAFRPFSYAEVETIMKSREGFSMDHHVPRNSTAPTEEELSS